MSNIGDIFPYSVPAVGTSGPGYATTIDSVLNELISRVSTKVPLSSLSYNANLDLSGQAVLNAAYLTLVNAAATPGSSPVNRLTAYLGDLWYVGPSGPIQLTSAGALNASGIGGITGNYGGANPAQLTYVAAQTRYDAYANFATGTWAYMRALGFDIAAGATSTVSARLQFAGLANLTFTLPATVPAATNAVLTVDQTGAITQGTTITASPSLSGAAQYKHTNNRQRSHVPFLSELSNTTGTPSVTAGTPGVTFGATADCYVPIGEVTVGNQVNSVVITNSGTSSVTYTLYKTSGTSSLTPVAGASGTSSSTLVTLTPTTPTPALVGDQYYVRIFANASPFTIVYITTNYSNP